MDNEEIEQVIEKIRELIDNKKINELHSFLEDINSQDLPEILDEFNEDDTIMIFRLLAKEKAAEVFVELDSDEQEKLINYLTDSEIKNVMNEIEKL